MTEPRNITYAVSLPDITGNDLLRQLVAAMVMRVEGETVEVDRSRWDGIAVGLDCDDERAEAIVAVIRKHYTRDQLRCWKRGKTWKRI